MLTTTGAAGHLLMPESLSADPSLLLQALSRIEPLSPELASRLAAELEYQLLARRTVLLEPGQVADRLYFIISGSARVFITDGDGRQHTTAFTGPDEFIIAASSFFDQQASAECVELLERSALLALSWQQLSRIYQEFPEFNHQMRRLIEKHYREAEQRTISFRTLRPAERYDRLLRENPILLQRASLGQVASYLGITQATLSRIRRRQLRPAR